MKTLHFTNEGIISLLDLTSMGDSVKRGDDGKIGTYDSGLKYAVAILLRNGVNFQILSGAYQFTFGATTSVDKITGKEKELIVVNQKNVTNGNVTSTITGFAKNLGFDWEFWMAIREIYSNCLDEGGEVFYDTDPPTNRDTNITIYAHPLVQDVIDNWMNYFEDVENQIYKNDEIGIYDNAQVFTVYKNGIKVFSNTEIKDNLFSYDYPNAGLDEIRVIRNKYEAENRISYALRACTDKDIINKILDNPESYEAKELMHSGYFSQEWIEVVNARYAAGEELTFGSSYCSDLLENSHFNVGRQRLSTGDSWYSPKVEIVAEVPELSFEDYVANICKSHNIVLKYPISKAKIATKSVQVIANKGKGLLHIDSTFTAEDSWQIIKEQYRLDKANSDQVYKDMVEILKNVL